MKIELKEAEATAEEEQEMELIEESKQNIEEEPFEARVGSNIYPNCWIEQHKLPLGLNALYIKDDRLIIDVTGKFMADTGFLGYINIHNIAQCLIKIRDLNHVFFNVAKAIEVTTVRLCDVTLDIRTLAQGNFIRALTSIFPIFSANNIIKKYGNSSIMIKSKADKVKTIKSLLINASFSFLSSSNSLIFASRALMSLISFSKFAAITNVFILLPPCCFCLHVYSTLKHGLCQYFYILFRNKCLH